MDLYVIHLPERVDRLEQIKSYFSSYNIIIIDAIKNEIGRIGCFLSHQKCIRLAKESNMKYICVLEDDCIPIANADDLLKIKDKNKQPQINNILDKISCLVTSDKRYGKVCEDFKLFINKIL